MDLTFTSREEAFRLEARTWLQANVPDQPLRSMDTAEGFEQHRDWERRLFDARWAVVGWPAAYGGRDATLTEWLLFEEEYWGSGAPGRAGANGLFLLAPTLFEHGTAEQQDRFLPPMASGEEMWCQGWSEPNAGSDLAAIRSRARRESGDWLLSGQKTWSSRGAFCDWMFGLFRSDAQAERHRGLTYFLVPLDAEGVTVRPVGRLDGDPGFAEIFLDDVRVPDSRVLGDVHQGWSVAMSTAGSERGLTLRNPARFAVAVDRLVDLYRRVGSGADPQLRAAVAQAWMDAEAYRLYTHQTVARLDDGGSIGPESSLNKIWWSELDVRLHETAMRLLGERAELDEGAPGAVDDGAWVDGFLFALAGPIYAGTNEIQRNVVAERVLGLPRVR